MNKDRRFHIREATYLMTLEAYHTAEDKGFWDDSKDVNDRFSECIALIHSELSESLEAHREGHEQVNIYDEVGEDSVFEELADTWIRMCDLAGHLEEHYNLEGMFGQMLVDKMEYNETRDYKHGKEY